MNSAPPISKFDSKSVKPHQFTPEELVPQNMIRKAKKVLVPDDCKDAKYWARRMKNNAAAKRSREARHQKVKTHLNAYLPSRIQRIQTRFHIPIFNMYIYKNIHFRRIKFECELYTWKKKTWICEQNFWMQDMSCPNFE